MKIQYKMLLAVIVIILVLITNSYINILTNNQMARTVDNFNENVIPTILLINDIRYESSKIISSTEEYVLSLNDTKEDIIEEHKQNFRDKLLEYESLMSILHPGEFEDVEQIGIVGEKLINISDEIVAINNEIMLSNAVFAYSYPVEKEQRYQIKEKVYALNNSKMTKNMGSIEYYSKETLYQYKDQKHLDKWVQELDNLYKALPANSRDGIKDYNHTIAIMGNIAIENRLKKEEELRLIGIFGQLSDMLIMQVNIMVDREIQQYNRESKAAVDLISRSKTFLYVLNALVVVGILLFMIIISTNIVTSINKLMKSALIIAGGQYDERVKLSSNDETKELGEAFNKMADSIQEKTIKLQNESIKLRQANIKLKEMDKAKTEFLYMASHELKTPLTPVTANIELMNKGIFGRVTKKQKERFKIIIAQVQKLTNIIRSMIDLTSLDIANLKKERTQVNNLIKDEVKKFDGVKLQLGKIPQINVDPHLIGKCINNLLSNAYKFSNKGIIRVVTEMENRYVKISVIDEGIGIAKSHVNKIFDKFYQESEALHGKADGVGLGLTMVKSVVEKHKGRVSVHSDEGKGSTFSIYLPNP